MQNDGVRDIQKEVKYKGKRRGKSPMANQWTSFIYMFVTEIS